jgi:hypothetical protein
LTFDETQQLLNQTFDGFIENQSETAAFKFKQLSIAIDETKEQVGAALLPAITALTEYIIINVVPVIQSFVDGLTGKDGLNEGLTDAQISAENWGKKIKGLITTVIDFKDELLVLGGVIAAVFTVSKISAGVTATIAAIKLLITAYNALKASAIVTGVATAFALNPLLGVGAVALAAAVLAGANALSNNSDINAATLGASSELGFPSGFANFNVGTPVAGTSQGPTAESIARFSNNPVEVAAANAAIAAKAATNVVTNPCAAGSFRLGEAASLAAASPTIVVNVSGAIDQEGTARTIVNTINDSYYRGTGGAGTFVA